MSDQDSDMEVDEPLPSEDDKMNISYWELEDDKVKYQRWTGEEFLPTLEGMYEIEEEEDDDTTGKQHTSLSDVTEHEERVLTELLSDDQKCRGCYSLLPNQVGGICGSCSKFKYTTKRTKVAMCDAPPQLRNKHEPLWDAKIQLKGCFRCKLNNLGITKLIDHTPLPLCTEPGGYAYFQDLASLDLRDIFPLCPTITTGAVLVRVMDFTIEDERILTNVLVKISRDDPRITNPYYFAKIVRREHVAASSTGASKKKVDTWTSCCRGDSNSLETIFFWRMVSHCNMSFKLVCMADIFSLPYLNDRNRIKTSIVNLSFKISVDFKYISRTLFNKYLLKRGMTLTWTLAADRQEPWPQPDTQVGCVYLYGFELEDAQAAGMNDCIYLYIGSSKNDARVHDKLSQSSLAFFETAHPTAKKFKTELFYVQKQPKSAALKQKKNKTEEGKPKKTAKIDPLTRAESKFIHAFLRAQLNNWTFKHFSPSYSTKYETFWPDLNFGDESLDKPIRLINRFIPGENYSKQELDEVCQIAKILLNAEVNLHYDWDSDCLKH